MLIRICNFRARNSCSNFQCWSNVCNQKFMSHKIFCAFIETKPINNIRKYRPQTCGIKTQLGEINVHLIVKLFQQKIDKSDSQSFCTIRRKISSKLFFFSLPTFLSRLTSSWTDECKDLFVVSISTLHCSIAWWSPPQPNWIGTERARKERS